MNVKNESAKTAKEEGMNMKNESAKTAERNRKCASVSKLYSSQTLLR